MSTSATRQQALSLFRRLLRAGRQWEGDAEEAKYIKDEAQRQFRAHQHDTDAGAIAKLLEEGETRLAIALHYKIAYPRLYHADQFAKTPYVQAPKLEGTEAPEAVASSVKDRGVAAKLEAAARRRRERLAQQQKQQQQQQEGGEPGGQQLGGPS